MKQGRMNAAAASSAWHEVDAFAQEAFGPSVRSQEAHNAAEADGAGVETAPQAIPTEQAAVQPQAVGMEHGGQADVPTFSPFPHKIARFPSTYSATSILVFLYRFVCSQRHCLGKTETCTGCYEVRESTSMPLTRSGMFGFLLLFDSCLQPLSICSILGLDTHSCTLGHSCTRPCAQSGNTALILAARAGHDRVVTLLLKAGAETTVKGEVKDSRSYTCVLGCTPLDQCLVKGGG